MKKWFDNLKVGFKVTLGFILVTLIAGIIGIVGIYSLNDIGNSYRIAYSDSTLALKYMEKISSSFQEIRANLFEMTLAEDRAYKESCISSINDHRKSIDENLASYKAVLAKYDADEVSTDLKLIAELEQAILDFASKRMEIMNGVVMDSSQRNEAFRLMSDGSELHTLAQKMEEAISALVDYNNDYAESKIKSNEKLVSISNLIMNIFIVIGIILAIITGITISRNISKRINKVVEVANKLSNGDFNIEIIENTNDEIGLLSQSFRKMSDTLIFIINDFSYILNELANANFTVKSKNINAYIGNYRELVDAARKMIAMLSDTIIQINTAADQVSTGSSQVSSGAQALAAGSTEQAASIEELSAAIEKIAMLIKENSLTVSSSATQVKLTENDVAEGNNQMNQLTIAMQDIEQASNQIASITKAIEDIAFQTNILALNAAIEAARAGNAGKGFAVVADEVRALAAKSGDAAKKTVELIEASIQAVAKGTEITTQTAEILQKVSVSASGVVESFDKIEKSSAEQTIAIENIRESIAQISAVIQTNAANAEENSATSEEMSAQAVALRSEVEKFKLNEKLAIAK